MSSRHAPSCSNADSSAVLDGVAGASTTAIIAEEAADDAVSTGEAPAACEAARHHHLGDADPPNGSAKQDYLDKLLSPYQQTGVEWMLKRVAPSGVDGGYRGCILGDETGVGKTLQVLALVLQCIWSGDASRVLIAVPSTLLESAWKREFEKWVPEIDPTINIVVTASVDAAARALRRLQSTSPPHHLIVLCSYEQLRKLGVVWSSELPLDLLVCDEAHRLVRAAPAKKPAPPPRASPPAPPGLRAKRLTHPILHPPRRGIARVTLRR
jgi:hypothetical protein